MLIDIDSEEFDKSKEAEKKGNLLYKNAIKFVMDINEVLPNNLPPHKYAVASYFLLKLNEMNLPFTDILTRPLFPDYEQDLQGEPLFTEENTDKAVINLGKNYLTHDIWLELYDVWQSLLKETKSVEKSVKILEISAIFAPRTSSLSEEIITPPTLVELGRQLLDIQPGENIADFCCGTGQFIVSSGQLIPDASYTGLELDNDKYAIAKIKTEMLYRFNKTKSEITQEDIFNNFNEHPEKKYNKIFSNYPFGIKFQGQDSSESIKTYIASSEENKNLFEKNKISSDWLFNKVLYDSLTENGKAVALMTTGSTINILDKNVRQYFIENNMIEGLISLPAKMFGTSAIATTMVVLGKNKTGKIKFVNASKIFTPGRRLNYLSKENISEIIEKYNSAATITINDFNDSPDETYQLKLIEEEERKTPLFDENDKNIQFLSLGNCADITRGAHFDAKELDTMANNCDDQENQGESKKIKYLQLKDIQNGIIEDIENLTDIDISASKDQSVTKKSKYEKYLIGENSIVISKNGAPFKVAFLSSKDKDILAAGNFYIINMKDNSKLLPKYVAAYFASNQGQQALEKISTGTAMQTISISNLKDLKIPSPDLKIQQEIIETYGENQIAIKNSIEQLKKAEKNIKKLFDKQNN